MFMHDHMVELSKGLYRRSVNLLYRISYVYDIAQQQRLYLLGST